MDSLESRKRVVMVIDMKSMATPWSIKTTKSARA
jgi:hypothetical protein